MPERMSPEDVARVAYAAGFRGEDLVKMVAIAKRESGWKPAAHRTDRDPSFVSGDRGLWQINYIHDDLLREAGIIDQPSDLFDPVINARAAKFVFDRAGWPAWGVGPGGWTQGGDPLYGTNVEEARQAVKNLFDSGNFETVGFGDWEWPIPPLPGPGVPLPLPGLGSLGDAWNTVQTVDDGVRMLLGALFSLEFWKRALQVVGGMVLMGMGLSYLARDAVISAVPGGQVVKAVTNAS